MNITSVHYIPEFMSTYRITEESATRSKNIEKVFRLRVSAAEIMIYLCYKYNLPSDIRSRFEGYRNSNLLDLAFHNKNMELAEEFRKSKVRWNYAEWLKYYGVIIPTLFNIFHAAWSCKNLFHKKYGDWG